MAVPVEAPQLGNTVEECIVTRWCKQVNEAVSAGDVVVEIETDKATFEVPSPVDGILLAAFFEEGAIVPVFTNLFVIGEPGEDAESFRPVPKSTPDSAAPSTQAHPEQTAVAPVQGSTLSPRARRFASEHGFHPLEIAGSGPGGRVLEKDLREQFFLPSRLPGLREKIARRMRESLAATAQYTLHSSAGAAGLLAALGRIRAGNAGSDININDLVAFCTIKALMEAPDLNAWLEEGSLRRHQEIHLGFACDTPRGLLAPVIHRAHSLTIAELAARRKALTTEASQATISPDDLSGATFTISNLGSLGIESFTPLLNPPQVAILGVGAIRVIPVRRDGRIEFIDSIALSLTCDHQVIDGAPGARFLRLVKEKIENVESFTIL